MGADFPQGFEGYPYASPSAEARIKMVTTSIAFIAVGLLFAGIYFMLFTKQVGIGGLLTAVGFVDLMIVPFLAKSLRRKAIQREGPGGLTGTSPPTP